MDKAKVKDPIWMIMDHQHRTMVWLAERTRYTHEYIRQIKAGLYPVTPEFRARCAFALDLPESLLFSPNTTAAPAPQEVA